MAENEISSFGFDGSEAFNELRKLRKALEGYNKILLSTAQATGKFNAEQEQIDDLLKRAGAAADAVGGQFKSLAAAQKRVRTEVQKTTREFAKQGAVSFGPKGRIQESPLAKIVAERQKLRQRELQAEQDAASKLEAVQTRQAAKEASRLQKQEQLRAKQTATRVAREAKAIADAEQAQQRRLESRNLLESRIAPGKRDTASLKEVVNFDKSLDQFAAVAEKSGLEASQLDAIIKNLGATYSGAARQVRDSAVQVIRANAGLSSSFFAENQKLFKGQQAKPQADPAVITPFPGRQLRSENKESNRKGREAELRNIVRGAKEAETALGRADDAGKNLNLTLGSLAKIAFTQIALSGLFRLIGVFGSAVTAAKDYEIQLASIQTISKEFATQDLSQISAQVREISAAFGLPIEDVASGLYNTLSNQVGTAAESMQFLGESAVFARAANLSLADSGDLLASVIKSYGLSAQSAADISGKLFTAIDLGRITGDELANTLGRVTALGRETGISIDEILASLSAFTIEGIDAGEAMTLISNVMLKLIKPTEALSKELDRLGIASIELELQTSGLQGTLQELTDRSGTAASEVGELFNQIRGTRGVLGLVGKSADNYTKSLEAIQKANSEVAKSAAEIIQRTPAAQLEQQAEELRGALVDGFGRPVIAVMTGVVDAVGGVKIAFGALLTIGTGLSAAIAGPTTITAIRGLTASLQTLATTSVLTRRALLGLKVAGIAGVITASTIAALAAAEAFTEWMASLSSANKDIQKFSDERSKIAESDLKKLKGENAERIKIIDGAAKQINTRLRALQVAYNEDFRSAIDVQERTNSSLQRQLGKRVSTLQSFVSQLQNIQERSADEVKKINDNILDLEFERGQGEFERSIRNLPEAKQADALVQRSQQTISSAQEAFGKGNKELAEDLIDTAVDLANRAADIDVSKQVQVNNAYKARIGLQNQLIAQEKARAAAAAEAEERNAQIADAVASRVERLSEINILDPKGGTSSKDAENNEQERLRLIREIEAEVDKVSGADATKTVGDIQARIMLKRLKAGFIDPLTGELGGLGAIAENQFNTIIDTVSRSSKNTPIELQMLFVDASGRPFDPVAGPKQIADAFAQNLARVRQELSSIEDLPGLERDIATGKRSISANQTAFRESIAGTPGAGEASQQAGEEFIRLVERFNQQIRLGDLEGAQRAQKDIEIAAAKMKTATEGLAPGDLSTTAIVTKATNNFLQSALQASATILESEAKAIPLREIAVNAQGAANELDRTGKAAAALTDSLEGFKAGLGVRPAPRVDSETGEPKARGGPIGPDTVRALLTPGEFVMNPRASQAFRPLLQRLNSMAMPRFAQGGSVTNVGDVNFNITTSRPEKINARTLAAQFQREIRKGTLK